MSRAVLWEIIRGAINIFIEQRSFKSQFFIYNVVYLV